MSPSTRVMIHRVLINLIKYYALPDNGFYLACKGANEYWILSTSCLDTYLVHSPIVHPCVSVCKWRLDLTLNHAQSHKHKYKQRNANIQYTLVQTYTDMHTHNCAHTLICGVQHSSLLFLFLYSVPNKFDEMNHRSIVTYTPPPTHTHTHTHTPTSLHCIVDF